MSDCFVYETISKLFETNVPGFPLTWIFSRRSQVMAVYINICSFSTLSSPSCSCSEEYQDSLHVLYDCPCFNSVCSIWLLILLSFHTPSWSLLEMWPSASGKESSSCSIHTGVVTVPSNVSLTHPGFHIISSFITFFSLLLLYFLCHCVN